MANEITERYNAKPYGFRFTTRTREEFDFDSKVTATSNMYYLGGDIRTVEDVETANDPDERILLQNMRGNGYKAVVTNCNSWKWTQPLQEGDVVLDYQPRT